MTRYLRYLLKATYLRNAIFIIFILMLQVSCKSRATTSGVLESSHSDPCEMENNFDNCAFHLIAEISVKVERLAKTYNIALRDRYVSAGGMGLSEDDDIKSALNLIQSDIKNIRKNGVKNDQNIDGLEHQITILQQQISGLERNNQKMSPDLEKQIREMVMRASVATATININAAGGVGINYGSVVVNNFGNGTSGSNNNPPAPKQAIPPMPGESLKVADRICVAQFLQGAIDQCRLAVVKIRYLDLGAIQLCEFAYLASDQLNCVMKIKDKSFDPREIQVCAGKFLPSARPTCLFDLGNAL